VFKVIVGQARIEPCIHAAMAGSAKLWHPGPRHLALMGLQPVGDDRITANVSTAPGDLAVHQRWRVGPYMR
jgi:hypothetical protein